MKRVPHFDIAFPPVLVQGAQLLPRNENLRGLFKEPNDRMQQSVCLRCPSKPCYKHHDLANSSSLNLCPVNAIQPDRENGYMQIGKDCVGCGLCAIRCPVGAIFRSEQTYSISPASTLKSIEEVEPNEFIKWIREAGHACQTDDRVRAIFLKESMDNCRSLYSNQFYPLIQSLFQSIGISAVLSNQGDTSNRIDLVLPDPAGNGTFDGDPIPVEIKSHTEVETINAKSIQQALENKLVVTRLADRRQMSPTSSLVVGYDYPADRTGITELIRDIELAYSIRIGLISLKRLFELLLSTSLDGIQISRETVGQLRGPL